MSDGKKLTVKSLSEELEKINLDVKEIHNLRKEVKELKEVIKELKENSSVTEQFQCTVCEVKLSSKGLLKKHKKENHVQEHECKHCD